MTNSKLSSKLDVIVFHWKSVWFFFLRNYIQLLFSQLTSQLQMKKILSSIQTIQLSFQNKEEKRKLKKVWKKIMGLSKYKTIYTLSWRWKMWKYKSPLLPFKVNKRKWSVICWLYSRQNSLLLICISFAIQPLESSVN